jgi:hypothetical protein
MVRSSSAHEGRCCGGSLRPRRRSTSLRQQRSVSLDFDANVVFDSEGDRILRAQILRAGERIPGVRMKGNSVLPMLYRLDS